jgi:hypothetical protein
MFASVPVDTRVPTEDAQMAVGGTAMTWRDELLIYWVFCSVLIAILARYVLDGATYLVDHVAAANVHCIPGLLHLLSGMLN